MVRGLVSERGKELLDLVLVVDGIFIFNPFELFSVGYLVLSGPGLPLLAFDAAILAVPELTLFVVQARSQILALVSLKLPELVLFLNVIHVVSEAPLSVILVHLVVWRVVEPVLVHQFLVVLGPSILKNLGLASLHDT